MMMMMMNIELNGMNRETALTAVQSPSIEDRLTAARVLAREARIKDLPFLKDLEKSETVPWIKHALAKAVRRLEGHETDNFASEILQKDTEYEQIDETRDHAIEATTKMLTHELEPVLGIVEFYAEREICNYSYSNTKKHLARFKRVLEGIKTLGQVAGAPRLKEFDLKSVVEDAVASDLRTKNVEIQIARTDPVPVVADQSYIELSFSNGLRNAIESTEAVEDESKEAITINFGKTSSEFWLTILDRGIGLKISSSGIFKLGNSSKEGHDGMGLALSQRAMNSLKGTVKIAQRDGGGVRYEMRWPVSVGVSDETASN